MKNKVLEFDGYKVIKCDEFDADYMCISPDTHSSKVLIKSQNVAFCKGAWIGKDVEYSDTEVYLSVDKAEALITVLQDAIHTLKKNDNNNSNINKNE